MTGYLRRQLSAAQAGGLPASADLGHLEAVACSAHCLEVAGVLGVGLDLLPDAPHVDIDGTGRDEAGIAPDRIEQMVAAEDAAGVAGQIVQQAKLCRGGGGELAAHLELHGAGVDEDLVEA